MSVRLFCYFERNQLTTVYNSIGFHPTDYYTSNSPQLPTPNLQPNAPGGRSNPTTLVGPQGTSATPTAPTATLPHPQASTLMHQTMPGNHQLLLLLRYFTAAPKSIYKSESMTLISLSFLTINIVIIYHSASFIFLKSGNGPIQIKKDYLL